MHRAGLIGMFGFGLASVLALSPATADFKQPDAYAMVIGISQPREKVIPGAAYAIEDAEAVAKLWETQAGIPKSHIRLVLAKGACPMEFTVENPVLASGKLVPASSGTQISSDYDKAGGGLFTNALLTGLHDAGDQDHDGLVKMRELRPYGHKQVAEMAVEERNKEQIPVLLPGEEAGARAASPVAQVAPGAPAKPGAPALGPPPVKDVDVDWYDQLDRVEQLAEKREQVWVKVHHFAGRKHVKRDSRLAALDKFLADFPDDNPHVGEVEALKQQIHAEFQVAQVPAYEAPRQAGKEIMGRDGGAMMLVPAGEFIMGKNDGESNERPVRRIYLDHFYIDKYEVTTARYAKFLDATGTEKPLDWEGPAPAGSSERPVVGVDWNDAAAYCHWAGKRLPTEAEWEKAARGTDGRKYPWGNEEPTSRHANFDKGCLFCSVYSGNKIVAVGSFEAGKSPFGAYDMAGNVWEWVADWYDSGYYQKAPDQNPKGPSTGEVKVLRGGSWGNPAYAIRSASLYHAHPSYRDFYHGFRCAKTP